MGINTRKKEMEKTWDNVKYYWGYAMFKIVKHLSKADPEITAELCARDDFTGKAIGLACVYNDKKYISHLLKNGANINQAAMNGDFPLHFATGWDKKEMTAFLLENGANVNAQGEYEDTPLHVAAENGYNEIVSVLLKHGANANMQNEDGNTPLHVAAEQEHVETFKKLIVEGHADMDIPNGDGKTAWDLTSPKMKEQLKEVRADYIKNKNKNKEKAKVQKEADVPISGKGALDNTKEESHNVTATLSANAMTVSMGSHQSEMSPQRNKMNRGFEY